MRTREREAATTVHLFCGAGGESAGHELAFRQLGLDVSRMRAHALNHWDLAVAVHGLNFPWIRVRQESIESVTAADFGLAGRRVNLLWASPSCVHFSRARGGAPTDATNNTRSHAQEVLDRWLRVADVDVLLVENVPEFTEWGPVYEDHSNGCDGTGPCKPGCHFGHPIPERRGESFRAWVADLRGLGYQVEWRVLCAADYGDPTTRRRFFLQAVRDGSGVRWPRPTHRNPRAPADLFAATLPAWRTAAECIDWTIPCPSIFDRKRPLAEATLRRIAAGVVKYVLQGHPFVVRTDMHQSHAGCVYGADEPLRTVTTGGGLGVVAPTLVQTGYGEAPGQAPRCLDVQAPLGTVVAGGPKHALVAAFLAKHFGGPSGHQTPGAPADEPMPSPTTKGQAGVVAAHLMTIDHRSTGETATAADAPVSTMTVKARHALVAAFLTHHYSQGTTSQDPGDPLHTVTTLARHGLVTVEIDGATYVIVDIGMRMLEPHELARAMGFPETFRWVGPGGKPLSKRDTVKMIGNAVPVNLAAALVRAVVEARPEGFGVAAGGRAVHTQEVA